MDQDILDLIDGVKEGRHEDFEIIRIKYKPLISDMAKRFEESGAGSMNDLIEEAERALLNAVLSYDSNKKGITFGLYAKICIRNALISVKRSNIARRKKEMKVAENEREVSRRAVISFGELSPDEVIAKLRDSLSQYESAVLREFFSGRSAQETAEMLGTDKKSVYNAVFRIRQKAKALGAVRKAKEKQI